MKKIISIIFLLIIFTVCGCKKKSPTPIPTPSPTPSPNPVVTKYEITFKNEKGENLEVVSVDEGTIPSYEYNVEDTNQWDYTFEGWSLSQEGEVLVSLPNARSSATYYAVVSKKLQKYSITFDSNGGSSVDKIEAEYGTNVDEPKKPTYQGYKFVSWCYDEALTQKVSWPIILEEDIKLYASWNEQIKLKDYLNALVEDAYINPESFIPDAMKPSYSVNIVNSNIGYDYTKFNNIENIKYGGFGEQWNMVINNVYESQLIYNVLVSLDDIISSSVVIFNNYFDSNPEDVNNFTTKVGDYNVLITFKDNTLFYILEFENEKFTSQIAMYYNIDSLEKVVRIQLNEANALKYVITPDSYSFAVRYAGVRRAYFEVYNTEEGCNGAIYEFLGLDNSITTSSCAEFYITEDFVSVVGNKANGMIGFSGYINELYETKKGKLLGYEVMETQSILGVNVTFNTLWFNLSDIEGIESIKIIEKENYGLTEKPYDVYINGSSDIFKAKNVGGINTKSQSRKYDIEMRTQYFYSYDEVNHKYVEHKVELPMMFIQEEQLETFSDDLNSVNKITTVISLNDAFQTKIMEDYDALIPTFIEHKELITVDKILEYIGNKLDF